LGLEVAFVDGGCDVLIGVGTSTGVEGASIGVVDISPSVESVDVATRVEEVSIRLSEYKDGEIDRLVFEVFGDEMALCVEEMRLLMELELV
jgi:hypothetical protein